jgi:hypothetical protein
VTRWRRRDEAVVETVAAGDGLGGTPRVADPPLEFARGELISSSAMRAAASSESRHRGGVAFLDEQRRSEKPRGSDARSRVSRADATMLERACLLVSTAARRSDSGGEGLGAAAEPSRVDGDELGAREVVESSSS